MTDPSKVKVILDMAARGKKISFTVSPWDFWPIVSCREKTRFNRI